MIDAREQLRQSRKVTITVELTGRQAAALLWWERGELRRAVSRATPRMRAAHRIVEALEAAAWQRFREHLERSAEAS